MREINYIKAYILGLLVGSGKIDDNTFTIDLPLKKWGMDPKRMGIIAVDILTKICNFFNSSYNFNVTYEIGNGKWLIIPIDNSNLSDLKSDLEYLGLPVGGFLLSSADLSIAKKRLSGIHTANFLSGIFDARASLTASHRRFTDDAPVVSIEIPGSTKNFKFVVQLCAWLTDLGSITDQILYNHPNQHASSDPDYKGWKKGFKIRFLMQSFLAQYSFVLQAKSIDAIKIEEYQKVTEQVPCHLRKLRTLQPISVHADQDSKDLPIDFRNKLFFHYHHFCAVIGCSYAPKEEIEQLVKDRKNYINFFPRLSKGTQKELSQKFEDIRSKYFSNAVTTISEFSVSKLLSSDIFKDFTDIEQGIAFLFAEVLKGKRHIGSMSGITKMHSDDVLSIHTIGENFDGPLLIINPKNDRAFICSSVNNKLNQQ